MSTTLWALIDEALIGDGQIAPLRVGDSLFAGLSVMAGPRRDAGSDEDGIRLLSDEQGIYRITGTARSDGYTWIIDAGDLRIVAYQEPRRPAVGVRYAVEGALAVAWDYEWDLATDPEMGGAPYDGRRTWRVLSIRTAVRPARDSYVRHRGPAVHQLPRWPDHDHWLQLAPTT
ncbi:hypothetical protein [Actinopolymorpha alba]|uniref:hypothetical protein n=1 Tax=Actinopolymorpha alba TaxID=533267 RepID=UPI000376F24C|nr:hypothetical protein [Actinopolymorpha alba]